MISVPFLTKERESVDLFCPSRLLPYGRMSLCSAFHRFPETSSLRTASNTSLTSLNCGRSTVIIAKVHRKLVKKDIGSPQDAWPDQMLRAFGTSLMAGIITTTTFGGTVSLAQVHNTQQGADLFKKACIGCHYEGGNVLQPGATLTKADLERNGVATTENIFNITYYGKGRMPGFGEKCTPRGQCTFGPRLSDDDIWLLAEFVKLQADQGWPKLEHT